MKWVVVTGANKGIGYAIVQKLLKDFADVAVFLGSRNEERGTKAIDGLPSDVKDRVKMLPVDVGSDDSVAKAAAIVKDSLGQGKLYGLVNNAGVMHEELKTVVNINAYGIKRVTEAFKPLLDQENGRIVNVASAAGPMYIEKCSAERAKQLTDPNVSLETLEEIIKVEIEKNDDEKKYYISKALANAFTLCFANKYPKLSVNSVTPGFIETDMTRVFVESSGQSPEEFGMKQPEDGAYSCVKILMRQEDSNDPTRTGRYYGSDGLRSPLHKYRGPGEPEYTD